MYLCIFYYSSPSVDCYPAVIRQMSLAFNHRHHKLKILELCAKFWNIMHSIFEIIQGPQSTSSDLSMPSFTKLPSTHITGSMVN